MSVDLYTYFELSFEFKLTPGANSGVKYRVLESEKRKGVAFGPEYQVVDDELHPDAKRFTSVPGSRTVAGLYDIIAPLEK